MKKMISFLLCLVLAVGMFAACGQGDASGQSGGESSESSGLPAVQQGDLLELITPDFTQYVEGLVIDSWNMGNGDQLVTIELDDGRQLPFVVSDNYLSEFLYRTYGPVSGHLIVAYLVDSGEPMGVYYTGEIVGEDTSNMYPQIYILPDYPPNYVQACLEDIRNRMAQMPQIKIHNFEEAIQAVIKFCGYTGMQRYTIPNGNIYYTNGEYWVYCAPCPTYVGVDGYSPEYCIHFNVLVMNAPCTSIENFQLCTYNQAYWVVMESGEVISY
ncbi:hypothetical protein LJB77_00360 [Ruminococcaceae bacterium OttesenSCG-928-N02]|nr:hypothetical protein [Ruminococcaceae bacterium OttesenSCG-928-N02]